MSKYTKMALVLLYLLQLMVVFREQLAHLYRSAFDSADHQADQSAPAHAGLRAVFERVVKIGRPEHKVAIVAAMSAPIAILHADHSGHGPHHDPGHDDDEKKDRAKKQRRSFGHEHLIRNLWERIRRVAPSPAALADHAGDIVRMITYSASSAPAA